MSELFELEAQARDTHGKAESRRLRRLEGLVPAVIYGAGKDAVSVSLDHNVVEKALEHEAFFSHILTLKTDKKAEKVILKDVQRHPYKLDILHMDFLRVRADEKLTMNVPLHIINEDTAPGVKAGGVVTHNMTEVEISCLPANLPEYLEVDLANVELDGNVHLSELKAPKGVEITLLSQEEPQDPVVAGVHTPRVEEEPEPETEEEAAEGETAEGEAASDDSAKADDAEDKGEDKKD